MRKAISLMLIMAAVIFMASCTNKKTETGSDRVMENVEVTTKVGISANDIGMKLPEIPELSWKFYDDKDATGKSKGKMTVKAHFKETRKYSAEVQLLDLNNLPVTTESLVMNGVENADETFTLDLHINKEIAKRITKGRVVVAPFFDK